METNEKLVIVTTIGSDHPEKATLPWVIGVAAQASDVEVVMILQSDAVVLAKQGEAEKIVAKGLMPVKELIDSYVEEGGKLLLCSPCLKDRNISSEQLIEGSVIIAAGTVVTEVLSAKSVLTY
ncbi:MAG: DsrE family protein [Prolixibacteraceae bacterium]